MKKSYYHSREHLNKNNTSGVNSIKIYWRHSRARDGQEWGYPYIIVYYQNKQSKTGRHSRLYSINKNGLEGALLKAFALRKKMGYAVPDLQKSIKILAPQLK